MGVGLARGLKALDGEPLPEMPVPNGGFGAIRSYKQSTHGTLAAYRQMLGRWPHKQVSTAGSLDYIGKIYVKPDAVDYGDFHDWSLIEFYSGGGVPPEGARIHWAHGDEPPEEEFWREIRFRGIRNRTLFLFITATPLKKSEWLWLRSDFPVAPNIPAGGRVTVVSTVYDNKALSAAHIAKLEAAAKNDPLEKARLLAEFVSIDDMNPFSEAALNRWAKRCVKPERVAISIESQRDVAGGRFVEEVPVAYERWEKCEPDESYMLIADPSLGKKSPVHDPAGIHVYARVKPRLVARYNGYLPPFALGNLINHLGLEYARALVDVEMNAGYGDAVINALMAKRYTNISMDDYADKPGDFATRLGFRTTAANRGELIGALQRALMEDSVAVWSEDVVKCLMEITIDERGKILAGSGAHDEDMILLGRACHLLETRPAPRKKSQAVKSLHDHMMKALGLRKRGRSLELLEDWR